MTDDPITQAKRRQVDAYLDTVERMEPDIHPVDHDGAMASIAISLKRIADAMEKAMAESAT